MARRKLWIPNIGSADVVAGTEKISLNLLANSPITGSNSTATVLRMVGTVYYKSKTAGGDSEVTMTAAVYNDSVVCCQPSGLALSGPAYGFTLTEGRPVSGLPTRCPWRTVR